MSRYQITLSGTSPELQELATQVNAVLARIAVDLKPPRFVRNKLPTDGSVRIAIVTDDSPPSLNFWDDATWQKLLV